MFTEAIGIDFGSKRARACVCKGDQVLPVVTKEGTHVGCYVSFNGSDVLVGEEAKSFAIHSPSSMIHDMKRWMGRCVNDEQSFQEQKTKWNFRITTKENHQCVELSVDSHHKRYMRGEEVAAIVLKELKQNAEQFVSTTIAKAVVSVPSFFNEVQAKAMCESTQLAGFQVLAMISEPVAAAKAYRLDKCSPNASKHVLVFNMGGSRLDVNVLHAQHEHIEIRSSESRLNLGGDDFLERLAQHVRNTFETMHNVDLGENPRSIRRLYHICETAKQRLSSHTTTTIQLDWLMNEIDFQMEISRDEFEELCMDLFLSMLEPVYQALSSVGMGKNDIDEIILAGGSARVPKVQYTLEQVFPGKTFLKSLPEDEIVAQGAALYAKQLCKQ